MCKGETLSRGGKRLTHLQMVSIGIVDVLTMWLTSPCTGTLDFKCSHQSRCCVIIVWCARRTGGPDHETAGRREYVDSTEYQKLWKDRASSCRNSLQIKWDIWTGQDDVPCAHRVTIWHPNDWVSIWITRRCSNHSGLGKMMCRVTIWHPNELSEDTMHKRKQKHVWTGQDNVQSYYVTPKWIKQGYNAQDSRGSSNHVWTGQDNGISRQARPVWKWCVVKCKSQDFLKMM